MRKIILFAQFIHKLNRLAFNKIIGEQEIDEYEKTLIVGIILFYSYYPTSG